MNRPPARLLRARAGAVTAALRLKLHDGFEAVGKAANGQAIADRLLAQAVESSFCVPSSMAPLAVPLQVETNEKRAAKALASPATQAFWDGLVAPVQRLRASARGLFVGRSTEPEAEVDQDFSYLFLGKLLNDLIAVYERREMPRAFRNLFECHIVSVLIADAVAPGTGLINVLAAALRAGFFPLRWSGVFPAGHLEVFCPADRPQAAAGAGSGSGALQPADAERAVEADVVARHQAHPGYADSAAVDYDHRPDWQRLVASGTAGAVAAHLSPLAARAADRAALEQIAARATRVKLGKGELLIMLRGAEGNELALRCAPPWSGAIAHAPADLIPVLRRHNGMRLDEPSAAIRFFPYNGRDFRISSGVHADKEEAEVFSELPWVVAPLLMPVTDGADFYVYHPTVPGKEHRACLLRVSHETAAVREDVGTGAGGLFLRLVAARLESTADG